MRAIKDLMILAVGIVAATVISASIASAAGLNVKVKDGIGSYLADEKGMTLYLFKKDSPGKSACGAANGCIEKWPVFFAENVDPAAGIDKVGIGFITREDGKKQTTYKGMPLYYFVKDKAAGDTLGQGVNSVWFIVTP
jgi:predicted lipoprotein with Yx(FWY)xxD motif